MLLATQPWEVFVRRGQRELLSGYQDHGEFGMKVGEGFSWLNQAEQIDHSFMMEDNFQNFPAPQYSFDIPDHSFYRGSRTYDTEEDLDESYDYENTYKTSMEDSFGQNNQAEERYDNLNEAYESTYIGNLDNMNTKISDDRLYKNEEAEKVNTYHDYVEDFPDTYENDQSGSIDPYDTVNIYNRNAEEDINEVNENTYGASNTYLSAVAPPIPQNDGYMGPESSYDQRVAYKPSYGQQEYQTTQQSTSLQLPLWVLPFITAVSRI